MLVLEKDGTMDYNSATAIKERFLVGNDDVGALYDKTPDKAGDVAHTQGSDCDC